MNKDDTNTKTNTDNTIEQDKQQDAPMSLRAIIREQATEDDMPLTKNITLHKRIPITKQQMIRSRLRRKNATLCSMLLMPISLAKFR